MPTSRATSNPRPTKKARASSPRPDVYNPYGLIWFFQKMTATYGKGQANWLRDHPLDQQRIDDLKHLFASDAATFGKFKDTQQVDVAYW